MKPKLPATARTYYCPECRFLLASDFMASVYAPVGGMELELRSCPNGHGALKEMSR